VARERELHLLLLGNPRHGGGTWRLPGLRNDTPGILRDVVASVKAAEAAAFDAVFFADTLNYGPDATWAYKPTQDFEPLTLTSALALQTERIGLVVTGSATLQAPYHLARQLLSLDHLSGGRAGWNVVTSFAKAAAANFNDAGVTDHDERYRVAEEALDAVQQLWDSWDDDTIVNDVARGVFNDRAHIHVPDHHGRYFHVRGPIGAARSQQGQPVIFQAGSSDTGLAFAARHAEVIFTGQLDLERGRRFADRVRAEARRAGRAGRAAAPLITPSLGLIIGSTDEEAKATEQLLYQYFSPEYQAGWLLEVEVDVTGAPLDGPVPASAFPASTQTHQTALAGYRALAAQASTVREFLFRTISAFGFSVTGSPERIADEIQRWYEGGAADGFVVRPVEIAGQLEAFTEHVVPILRKRGLFRHEYQGTTLRDHLGLTPPASRYHQ
jgi:FMN-dependent oxidoreductase (nitrilotriacetate monooxygenase family)